MKSLAAIFLLLFILPLHASDWPRFRGPDGAGVSTDKNLPASIDRNGEDVIATPAIADEKIYIRTLNSLYCFANKKE